MATKTDILDDNKSVANAPPPYDSIPTSTSSARSVRHRPSVFSFLNIKQKISKSLTHVPPSKDTSASSANSVQCQKQTTVLSRIRDIVSAPDIIDTPSVALIVDACTASLSVAEFSDLLQSPNIEGHTALYWAIVNKRQEAFSAFAVFITKFSPVCSSDLRLACVATHNQALFVQLGLGYNDPKDEPLRRSLGCPPDDVQVHEGDGLGENQFIACIHIRMFRKRLHITQDLGIEFIAGGRIWMLRFYMGPDGRWRIGLSLSQPSFPARPDAKLLIEAHTKPGCINPPQGLVMTYDKAKLLVPGGSQKYTGLSNFVNIFWSLSDWLLYDNTIYTDCDGTLHASLDITLR
ncbi:hypothetical protein DFJ58DRAFT_698876 [Suillus subalutaceus]|uniref:uncharacterized protein n=1 Tax=Suillus subalutaceus TaxID=48586 RepID=UPI001B85EC4D|nr:uncharacterized protein DFJ58DRAFT_698876 [Suillus subalutaceus]KAG1866650.1 hypothetical protein DFJ58DRAFT_698876 [Suillus subalutaceus]